MTRRRLVRLLVFLAVSHLITSAFLAWTPQGRAGTRAGFLVLQVVPAVPIKPLSWFTPDPRVEQVTLPLPGGGTGLGTLYLPEGEGPHPAVLLFLGVAPAGSDDERVVNLGEGLARSGLAALFYWSPEMAAERMTVADVDNVVAAFQHLRARPEVDPGRVGMGGFCVGASYALVAAAHPAIRDDVRYVNAFGPYYDLRALAVALSSQSQEIDGRTESWPPSDLARRVFVSQMISGVRPEEERVRLAAFAQGGPQPRGLSAEGQAAADLIGGLTPERAWERVPALSLATLREWEAVSPKTSVAGVHARVLVMHDRLDKNVPAQESRALAAALDALGRDAHYTEFAFFEHMDPTRDVGAFTLVKEGGRLFLHLYVVMREAF